MSQTPIIPIAAVAEDISNDPDSQEQSTAEAVGEGDHQADMARTGADPDDADIERESDGVPTGAADAEADARASGAEGR